jgi:hypothetical protein
LVHTVSELIKPPTSVPSADVRGEKNKNGKLTMAKTRRVAKNCSVS